MKTSPQRLFGHFNFPSWECKVDMSQGALMKLSMVLELAIILTRADFVNWLRMLVEKKSYKLKGRFCNSSIACHVLVHGIVQAQ